MHIFNSIKKLETFVYLILTALPLVFLPFLNLNFELAKVVFARSMILLFFLFWGLSVIKKNKINIPSILRNRNIIKCLIFLFIVLLVSNFSSIAPKLSFWGSYFRMQGLYSYMHYFLFFFLILFTLRKDVQWKNANNCICLIYFFLLFLAVLQFLGFDPFFFQSFQNHGDRIAASFSNPNFFASFLLLLAFPVLAFLDKKNNFYIGLIILLSFFVLILTGSKGAIIGFIVGFFFYALFNKKYLKDKKYLYFLGLVLSLIFSVIFFASKTNFLYRFDLNKENLLSTNTRLEIWEDSLIMIQDKTIFGFGLETFPIVFHEYSDLDELNVDYLFGLIDKTHNTFLEFAYSTGFLGLIVYVFIIYSVLSKFLRKMPSLSKNKKSNLIAVMSGLIAFFVSILFSFSVTVHFIFLSFYLAYFLYLISNENLVFKLFKSNFHKKLARTLLLFFVIGSLVFNNLFYLLADSHAKKAFQALEVGDTNTVVENFYKANFYNPNQSYYNYWLAAVFVEINETDLAKIYLENAADFESKRGDFYQFLKEKIY